MALNVKGKAADSEQLAHGKLICEITRGRGGDGESIAGAIATAIQESTLRNLRGGDRDSAGLYQQRPSCSWGSYSQVTNPTYAINKFLDKYLAYRKQGMGWLQASHKTQASAHPSAPARWYSEGNAFSVAFTGSGGGNLSFIAGSGDALTQVMPYEFTRGTADRKEDTWTCSGRLAEEVGWRRYMSGGAMWFVSEDWLFKQPVAYRLDEWTAGVVKLAFDFETRTEAAEAALTVATRRYSFLPGDIVELVNEGPANGKWVVAAIRRNLFSQLSEVTLRRKRAKLPEPAAETRQVTVGGDSTGAIGGTMDIAAGAGGQGQWGYAEGAYGLTAQMQQCVAECAGFYGKKLMVNSGRRPGSAGSDHQSGNGADFGMVANRGTDGGPVGDAIAVACLRAFGLSLDEARAAVPRWTGFNRTYSWRGRRAQIGWRTNVGGNHFNHVHIGIR